MRISVERIGREFETEQTPRVQTQACEEVLDWSEKRLRPVWL